MAAPRQELASSRDFTATLPLDVLQVIVSLIEQRRRLLFLTRVCHRWRTVVHRTVTSLPPTAPAWMVNLPSVTELTKPLNVVSDTVLRFRLPTTLRSLSIVQHNDTDFGIAHISHLSSLTSLNVDCSGCRGPNRVTQLMQFARQNIALTELKWQFPYSVTFSQGLLQFLSFPLLRSVDVFGPDLQDYVHFYKAHASQLTSVVIHDGAWNGIALPECNSILYHNRGAPAPMGIFDAADLLSTAPKLASLGVDLQVPFVAAHYPAHLITSLKVTSVAGVIPVTFLAACVQLRSLSVHAGSLPMEEAVVSMLTRLESLEYLSAYAEKRYELLLRATQLRSLTVSSIGFGHLVHRWTLSQLRSLNICDSVKSMKDILSDLSAVAPRVPHLRSLMMQLKYRPSESWSLSTLLDILQAMGVESVDIRVDKQCSVIETRFLRQHYRRMRVHVHYAYH